MAGKYNKFSMYRGRGAREERSRARRDTEGRKEGLSPRNAKSSRDTFWLSRPQPCPLYTSLPETALEW